MSDKRETLMHVAELNIKVQSNKVQVPLTHTNSYTG